MNTREISQGNPLVERVQRHATMAVLFRSPTDRLMKIGNNPARSFVTASILPGTESGDLEPADAANQGAADNAHLGQAAQSQKDIPVRTPTQAVTDTRPIPALPLGGGLNAQGQAPLLPSAQELHAQLATPAGTNPESDAPATPALVAQHGSTPHMLRAAAHTVETGATQVDVQTQKKPALQHPTPARVEGASKRDVNDSSVSDPVWHRLQTIYRKHQELAAGGEMATGEPSSSVAGASHTSGKHDTRQPRAGSRDEAIEAGQSTHPIGASPVSNSSVTGEGANTGELYLPAISPSSPSHQESLTASSRSSIQPRLNATTQSANTKAVRQGAVSAQLAGTQPTAQDKESRPTGTAVQRYVDNLPQATAVTKPSQGSTVPENDARREVESESAHHVLAETPVGSLVDQDQQLTGMAVNQELPLQPVPLEAVWPIQRQGKDMSTAGAESPVKGATTLPQPLATVEDPALQSILQILPTGRPTQSEIEVLPPRKPRPSVQRRENSIGGSPPAIPVASAPDADTSPRASEMSARASPLVETEIGLLPGDLWELIGQTPPSRVVESSSGNLPSNSSTGVHPGYAGPQALGMNPATDDTASTDIHRKEFTSEEPARRLSYETSADAGRSSGHTVPDMPGVTETSDTLHASRHLDSSSRAAKDPERLPQSEVRGDGARLRDGPTLTWEAHETAMTAQRAWADEGRAGQPPSVEGEASDQGQSVDINKLAAEVYAVLRRRLSVEWERLRER